MAWRQHGRASVDPRNPRAFGCCDRCSLWYNLIDLHYQFDWRGNHLQNLWIRVCNDCYDKPQQQLRPRVLPADPVPVYQPRPDNFAQDNAGISDVASVTPPVFTVLDD